MAEQPQFASEAQKRELCSLSLQDYLDGDNVLSRKLDRTLKLHITPQDQEALLNRIMREPTPQAIERTTSLLLRSGRPEWRDHLTETEQKITEALQPRVQLHFRCFSPPSGDAWGKFYEQYGAYLLEGTDNKMHLKEALEKQCPLEVGFATFDGAMLRFIVLQPFPANQCGARLVVNKS